MKVLQRRSTELEEQNAMFALKVKYQQSDQEEMRAQLHAQQLAHTKRVDHLFSEIAALKTAHRN